MQLYDDSQDIGQEIRLWLARPGNVEDWKPEGAGSSSFSYVTISGDCEVFLSHPGSGPAEFYVSRADSSAALSAVMRDIHQLAHQGNIFPLTSASPGLACLARYEDGVWYRARVESVAQDRSQAKVYYVDYGNTASVPLASLAVIPPSLVTVLPAQAVQCRLAGLGAGHEPELTERWTHSVTERLSLQVEGVDCGVHVVVAHTAPSPRLNLNQELGRKGARGVTGVGEIHELLVTWVESSNSWYGQLLKSDVRDFLVRLSEEIGHASLLYKDSRHHNKGQMCAVPDTRSQAGHRYLRGVITREHKDSVEVRLMDVGGREKFYKNKVFCLPAELSKRPEHGVICSFGLNPALNENKFKDCMLHSVIEVKVLKKIGDGVEVMLTSTKSRKLKNSAVSSVLELLSSDSSYEARLKSLYEKQNNKHNNRMSGGETNGASSFERGDLRNSLREKRAAREKQVRTGPGLSLMSFKSGWRGEGKITWMYSPAHFYLQVAGEGRDTTAQFEELMTRLQEAMVTRRQELVRVGQIVAARWRDGCWYRGQVVSVKQNKMEIFFVDFGNTEKVDKEDLAVLPADFCYLRCQAVRVFLAGVEADWEKLEGKLAKFFDKESFSVEIIGQKDKDGAFPVQLNEGEIVRAMIKQKLVKLKECSELKNGKKQKKERSEKETSSDSDVRSERDQSQGKKIDEPEETVSKAAKLRKSGKLYALGDFPGIASSEYVGRSVSGTVSHFVSWKHFWLQVQPDVAEDLKEKLNTGDISALHGRMVKSIEVGECCLVLHDEVWYRAAITHKWDGGAMVEALLVDWGLAVRLPLSQVRDGDFQLYDRQPAALRCRLDNKMDNFEKFINSQDEKISVRVRNFRENTFMVKVDKGKKEKGEECREQVEVVVVHVESVDKVWLVERQRMPELEELMLQLSASDPQPQSASLEAGSLCCVRYSEDGELYRARLGEVRDGLVTVQYIDYGNSEQVQTDQVLVLAEEFQEMEAAARQVTVKFCNLALDCEKSRTKLEEILAGEKLSVSFDQSGEATFWSSGHKLEMTKSLGCVKDESLHMFRVSSSPRVSCTVSHVEGEKVWLKLTDMELEQRLSETLQERARRLGKAGKVHVGDFVVARYSGDRKYYRARVVRMVGGHKAELLYIDYGNKETVDVGWLKMLPGELRLCPGLASVWSLDNRAAGDDLRRVTGPELLDSHVIVDLVQPRSRSVTLWQSGVRLALTTGIVSLPVRLRPADTWLALITTNTGELVSLLDLNTAASISQMLNFYKTDIDVRSPVVGRLYCQTVTGGARRRVLVTERGKQTVSVSGVDSEAHSTTSPASLQTLAPRLATACPATLSCVPSSSRRYLTRDKLVLVTVNSANTIKMVELSLRVSPTFSHSGEVELTSQLTLSPDEDKVLSVRLPEGTWTSNSLSQAREMLLQTALGLSVSDNNLVTKSYELPCDLVESLGVTSHPEVECRASHRMDNVASTLFRPSTLEVGSLEVASQDENISVSSYSELVPLLLSSTEELLTVVDLSEDSQAILKKKSSVARFQVSDLESAVSVETSKIYLYKEDEDSLVRVFVKRVSDENLVADVRVIDTGRTILCQPSELYQLTSELCKVPAALLQAKIITERTLTVGDELNGKLVASDNKLELRL